MKFLIDENVHIAIFHFLIEQGFDVTSAAQDYSSFTDQDILAIAEREERTIVTNDKDFGYLVYYQRLSHRGIILFRLKSERPQLKIDRLKTLLRKNLILSESFVVITEERIRIKSRGILNN